MEQQDSAIPKFRSDGYLPEGLYLVSEAEVMFRFGSSSGRRRRMVLRIRRWVELARLIGGLRLLIVSCTREADGRRKGLVEVKL